MTVQDEGFVDALRRRGAERPDGVFARVEGRALTFGELNRRSSAFAAALRADGIGPGDRVAVMMRNGAAAIVVVFGLARAGIVWVPVNAQQRGEGLAYLLAHSEPRLVVVDVELEPLVRDAMPDGATPLVVHGPGGALDGMMEAGPAIDGAAPAPRVSTCEAPAPDAPAAIMYTSGTTGPPKGVIVTHRMLRLAADAVCLVSAIRPGDVMFVWEPLYHIGGAQLLPLPLVRDVTLAMVERFSASRFWDQVAREDATHIHHLGGILQLLLKQPPSARDRRHRVRIAWGGGCPAEIWRSFEERFGVEIRECYGMTEASSITTFNETGTVGSVGRPVPWFSVSLTDAAGEPVRDGERGEIVVATSRPGAIFPGYFRNPDATARALRAGRLHTGDLGSRDRAGNLLFHGRMTDSVRCRGENVSAWEVEHVAAQHESVEDCAMIGVAAEIGEQEIKLFVKPRAGASLDPATLSCWLEARLAPYQNPRFIAIVDAFERTASQRIMKHRLPPGQEDCWDRAARPGQA